MYDLHGEEKKIINDGQFRGNDNGEYESNNGQDNEDENSTKMKRCFLYMINNWEFMSLQFLLFTMFAYNFFLYNLTDNLQLFYLYNIIDAIINLIVVNLFLLFITTTFTTDIYKDDFKKSIIFLLIIFSYFIFSDIGVIIYCKDHSDTKIDSTDITLISISIIGKIIIEIILIYNLHKNTGEPIDFSDYFDSDIEEMNRNIMNEAIRVGKEQIQEHSSNILDNSNNIWFFSNV